MTMIGFVRQYMNICMVLDCLVSTVADCLNITNPWQHIKQSTILMIEINKRGCTCCGHHT